MNPKIEFSIKTAQAYNAVCKPLCQELGLSQTALDILLFLANNPDYKTARDIVEVRHRQGRPDHPQGACGAECLFQAPAGSCGASRSEGLFPDHGADREKSGRNYKGERIK